MHEREITMSETKKRILYEALRLFSKKGYDGVSMREIAQAVGIKGASIYNHFKGKEEIFEAIFEEMVAQYNEAAGHIGLPVQTGDATTAIFTKIGSETLFSMVDQLLQLFTQNEFVVSFRRLLISEQHKSALAANYYKAYYLEAPIQFQSEIFAGLKAQGAFVDYDAQMLALHFYSPIFLLLCRFDMGLPYEECKRLAEEHVSAFLQAYGSRSH